MEEKMDRNRIDRLYQEAVELMNRGERDKSRDLFERVVALDPGHVDGLNELGRYHHAAGDFPKAESYFERTLRVKPDFLWGHYNLGILYRDQQDPERALRKFEEALAIAPDDLDSLNEAGRLHWQKGDPAKGETLFRHAIRVNADYWRGHYNLAKLLAERGDYEGAIRHHRSALRVEPANADILNDFALCYYDTGDFRTCAQYLGKAIDAKPDYHFAHHNLGLCHQRLGDPAAAQAAFERAVAIKFDYPLSLYELGKIHHAKGDQARAQEFYERAVAADPCYHVALNNLGLLFYDRSDYRTARRHLQHVIELAPTYAPAFNNLGLCALEEKNFIEARTLFARAIKLQPDYFQAIYNVGLSYLEEGLPDRAVEHFHKALQHSPEYPYALYGLGRAAFQRGDPEAAKGFHRRALATDPAFGLSRTELTNLGVPLDEFDALLAEKKTAENARREAEKPAPSAEPAAAPADESLIRQIGRNLNELAAAGKLAPCVGREKEIGELVEVLYRRFKNNPLLIGQPGVGKTALVEGLAQRIVAGEVPDHLKAKEVIELNTGFLIAGTSYRGQFESKVQRIIDEAKANPNLILFIDEVHTIMGAGRVEGGNLDLAQMFKPALARGEITCIGATTLAEYRKYIERDAALERRFYPVRIEELDPRGTAAILHRNLETATAYYKVEATREHCDEVVDLAGRYLKKRYFPDKAIDLFEKTLARVSLAGRPAVTSRDIKAVVGEMAGINFLENDPESSAHLMRLAERLKADVIGQDAAIDRVADVILITKRRMDLRPEQPDGVFLFTGPTGVGKTHLAKMLARHLYGSEERLIRLDMSEFSEPHSVSKLVGAPPGYVGYDDEPALTSKIEEHPTSILLLDEIEKAHPEVHRLLLQIFDEGRITDSKGKKIHFSDTTIVMTSNAIAKERGIMGFVTGAAAGPAPDVVRGALAAHFPKEFLNRIDEVILFAPLGRAEVERILADHVFPRSRARFTEEGIALEFSPALVSAIVDAGYDADYGARNLERAFEKLVLAPLVNAICARDCRGKTLRLDWADGALAVRGAE